MMRSRWQRVVLRHGLALGLLVTLTTAATAGPSLPVTKPPVVSGANPDTGPNIDPTASRGQWFTDVTGFDGTSPILGSNETVRPLEFYDNLLGDGGGDASTNSIIGFISSHTEDGAGNVTTFTVTTTISNDLASLSGPWADGSNSHGESLSTPTSYVGPLIDTKLTASFADNGSGNTTSNIYAIDYDEVGWYSFNSTGSYQVPTWDFGDIPLGGSVTRDLTFGFFTPVANTDPAWTTLVGAGDLFSNRTTSLKISNYDDSLTPDDGTAYPDPPSLASDVSVFHTVPEPGSLALLGLGALGLFAARRRGSARA